MRRLMIGLAAMAVVAVCFPATASELSIEPPATVPPLPKNARAEPFDVERVVFPFEAGHDWGVDQQYPVCRDTRRLKWRPGVAELKPGLLKALVYKVAREARFTGNGDPESLFEEAPSDAEYVVSGLVRKLDGRICSPQLIYDVEPKMKGQLMMSVGWQVYSRIEKRIVAKIETQAGFELTKAEIGNRERLIVLALGENVKRLLASEEFRKLLIITPAASAEPSQSDPQTLLRLPVGKAAGPVKVPEAIDSVVLILVGGGHGSGFLVSTEGHILTANHVVGSARSVKLRWADGTETRGEVLRADRRRDVALIKTEAAGRKPLLFRKTPITPGETVIAVGAPAYENFQGTVTRGVVSAHRTHNRLSYIQSDVTVSQGKSGGPLLDEQGRIVGICNLGIQPTGVPIGISLFTPIAEAARHLAVEQ